MQNARHLTGKKIEFDLQLDLRESSSPLCPEFRTVLFILVDEQRQYVEFLKTSNELFASITMDELAGHRKCRNVNMSSILYKRLLQEDCQRRGWVLVGYPKCLPDLKNMMENFMTPPNK